MADAEPPAGAAKKKSSFMGVLIEWLLITIVAGGTGATWTALPIPTPRNLYGAAHDNGELVVVGDSGAIFRFNGLGWSEESFAARRLRRGSQYRHRRVPQDDNRRSRRLLL